MARADIGRAAEETVREILFVTGPRPGEVRAGNQKQKRGDRNTPTQSIRSATGLSAGHPRAVRAAAARGTCQGRPPAPYALHPSRPAMRHTGRLAASAAAPRGKGRSAPPAVRSHAVAVLRLQGGHRVLDRTGQVSDELGPDRSGRRRGRQSLDPRRRAASGPRSLGQDSSLALPRLARRTSTNKGGVGQVRHRHIPYNFARLRAVTARTPPLPGTSSVLSARAVVSRRMASPTSGSRPAEESSRGPSRRPRTPSASTLAAPDSSRSAESGGSAATWSNSDAKRRKSLVSCSTRVSRSDSVTGSPLCHQFPRV